MIKKSSKKMIKWNGFQIKEINIEKIETSKEKKDYLKEVVHNGGSEWAIYDCENNKIGAIGIKVIEKSFGVGEIRYGMKEEYQNKGIMSDIVRCMIDFWFNECNYHTIQCIAAKTNIASIRVMQKCNMEKVGILKEYCLKDNKYVDCVLYSIINKKRA